MIFFMNKEIEIKKVSRNFLSPKLRHNRHILGKNLNQILNVFEYVKKEMVQKKGALKWFPDLLDLFLNKKLVVF